MLLRQGPRLLFALTVLVLLAPSFLTLADPATPINAHGPVRPHPRMILNGDFLWRLQARATQATPEWSALKLRCDALAEMPVRYFNQTGSGIGEGYQGGEYFNALMNLGVCRHVVMSTDPALATRYGMRMTDILRHM
ncbi:MAG: hypothetical protein JO097_07140, partial [Acidobacteriaceae bacterium]|nr:hypothetical protein [Acidobacteriaceae bacterium]